MKDSYIGFKASDEVKRNLVEIYINWQILQLHYHSSNGYTAHSDRSVRTVGTEACWCVSGRGPSATDQRSESEEYKCGVCGVWG